MLLFLSKTKYKTSYFILFLIKILVVGLAFFILVSCNETKKEIRPAFYHWQTSFDLSEVESNYLSELKVEKLYLKFFDVDWKDGAYPMAILQLKSEISPYEIVPTIFITNRTLLEIVPPDLPDLADKIAQKISHILPKTSFQEIQFDCDWSGDTQQKYFELLRLLRQHFPQKKLTATIRLHQIKFFERTGVPPVDRGMLMCYNVGKIDDWTSENSILDSDIVLQYLDRFEDYPLALDVALPVFQWGLLFRDDQLNHIFNNLDTTNLQDSLRFQAVAENRYEVIKSTYLNGRYLYEGDLIRLEDISETALHHTAELLAAQLPKHSRHIVFYHLDTINIQQHPYEKLEVLLEQF